MSDYISAPDKPVTPASAPITVNTVWIWIILAGPFVAGMVNGAITLPAMLTNPTSLTQPGIVALRLILPLVIWIALIVCAFLDERHLKRAGVHKPFPWGWAALWSIVYVIGRSVVVIRRTDNGRAPLWGALVYLAVVVVSFFVVFAVLVNLVRG